MLVKQKNLRVFYIEITDKQTFLEYYNKNRIILKEFFLLIKGKVDEQIVDTLNGDGVCFKDINDCNIKLGSVKKEVVLEEEKPKPKEKTLFEEEKLDVEKSYAKTFHRPIRSGEEITEEIPVSVFGRINSGAKLFCSQNVSIYGEVDGLVQCDGEYLIISGISPRGMLYLMLKL